MNTEVPNTMEILGFPKVKNMPNLKDVRKQFFKLAKIRHSDKPIGNDRGMRILLEAYNKHWCINFTGALIFFLTSEMWTQLSSYF